MWRADPRPFCFFIILVFNRHTKTTLFFTCVPRPHTLLHLYFPPNSTLPLGDLIWAWIGYIVTTTGSIGRLGFLLRSMARQESWSIKKPHKGAPDCSTFPFFYFKSHFKAEVSVSSSCCPVQRRVVYSRVEACCLESATANPEGWLIPVGLCC